MTTEEKASLLATALAGKGAVDVKTCDLRGRSSLADFFILATGAASPHLKALAAAAEDAMRSCGEKLFRTSGDAESGWIAVDFIDTVVHVFSPEARRYYALDKLYEQS